MAITMPMNICSGPSHNHVEYCTETDTHLVVMPKNWCHCAPFSLRFREIGTPECSYPNRKILIAHYCDR